MDLERFLSFTTGELGNGIGSRTELGRRRSGATPWMRCHVDRSPAQLSGAPSGVSASAGSLSPQALSPLPHTLSARGAPLGTVSVGSAGGTPPAARSSAAAPSTPPPALTLAAVTAALAAGQQSPLRGAAHSDSLWDSPFAAAAAAAAAEASGANGAGSSGGMGAAQANSRQHHRRYSSLAAYYSSSTAAAVAPAGAAGVGAGGRNAGALPLAGAQRDSGYGGGSPAAVRATAADIRALRLSTERAASCGGAATLPRRTDSITSPSASAFAAGGGGGALPPSTRSGYGHPPAPTTAASMGAAPNLNGVASAAPLSNEAVAAVAVAKVDSMDTALHRRSKPPPQRLPSARSLGGRSTPPPPTQQSRRAFAYQQSPQRAPAAGDDSDDAQAAALCRCVDSEGGAGTLRAVRGTSRLRLMHHQANGGGGSDVGGGALPKAQVAAAAFCSTGSAACDDGDEVNSPAAAGDATGAAVFTGVPPSVPAVGLLGGGSLLVVRSTAGILPGVSGAPPAAFGGARWSVLPVTPEAGENGTTSMLVPLEAAANTPAPEAPEAAPAQGGEVLEAQQQFRRQRTSSCAPEVAAAATAAAAGATAASWTAAAAAADTSSLARRSTVASSIQQQQHQHQQHQHQQLQSEAHYSNQPPHPLPQHPAAASAAAACWRKSPVFRPLSVSQPHHLTFHVAGLGGCLTFLAAFAPAALEPVMKDSLGLERSDLHAASLATLAAALAMQFVMAAAVRRLGPRYCQVAVLLGLAPVLACMALLTAGRRAELFVLLRLLLGAGLSLGVVTRWWMGNMFEAAACSAAATAAAGLSYMGAGLAPLLLPPLYLGLEDSYHATADVAQDPEAAAAADAWRCSFFVLSGLCLAAAVLTLLLGQDCPHGDVLDPKPLPARGVLLLEGGVLGGGGGGGIKMGVGVEEWSPELAAEAAWQQQRRVAALFDKRKAEGRLKQLQALRERHDTRKSQRRSGRDGGGSGNAGLLQRLTGGSLAPSGLDGGRPAGAAAGADSSGSRRKPSSPVAMAPAVGFGRSSRQRPEEVSEDGEVFDILNTVNTILSISDHQRPSMFGAPASSMQLNLTGETPRPITSTAAPAATATAAATAAAAALIAAAANEARLGKRLLPTRLAVAGSSWSHSPAVATVHTAGSGRSLSNCRPAQAAAAAAPALRCGQGSCSGRISTRLSMRPASPRHEELKRRASAVFETDRSDGAGGGGSGPGGVASSERGVAAVAYGVQRASIGAAAAGRGTSLAAPIPISAAGLLMTGLRAASGGGGGGPVCSAVEEPSSTDAIRSWAQRNPRVSVTGRPRRQPQDTPPQQQLNATAAAPALANISLVSGDAFSPSVTAAETQQARRYGSSAVVSVPDMAPWQATEGGSAAAAATVVTCGAQQRMSTAATINAGDEELFSGAIFTADRSAPLLLFSGAAGEDDSHLRGAAAQQHDGSGTAPPAATDSFQLGRHGGGEMFLGDSSSAPVPTPFPPGVQPPWPPCPPQPPHTSQPQDLDVWQPQPQTSPYPQVMQLQEQQEAAELQQQQQQRRHSQVGASWQQQQQCLPAPRPVQLLAGPGGAPSTATPSSKPPPSAAGLGDQQPPFGAYLLSVCSGSSTRGCATATGGSRSAATAALVSVSGTQQHAANNTSSSCSRRNRLVAMTCPNSSGSLPVPTSGTAPCSAEMPHLATFASWDRIRRSSTNFMLAVAVHSSGDRNVIANLPAPVAATALPPPQQQQQQQTLPPPSLATDAVLDPRQLSLCSGSSRDRSSGAHSHLLLPPDSTRSASPRSTGGGFELPQLPPPLTNTARPTPVGVTSAAALASAADDFLLAAVRRDASVGGGGAPAPATDVTAAAEGFAAGTAAAGPLDSTSGGALSAATGTSDEARHCDDGSRLPSAHTVPDVLLLAPSRAAPPAPYWAVTTLPRSADGGSSRSGGDGGAEGARGGMAAAASAAAGMRHQPPRPSATMATVGKQQQVLEQQPQPLNQQLQHNTPVYVSGTPSGGSSRASLWVASAPRAPPMKHATHSFYAATAAPRRSPSASLRPSNRPQERSSTASAAAAAAAAATAASETADASGEESSLSAAFGGSGVHGAIARSFMMGSSDVYGGGYESTAQLVQRLMPLPSQPPQQQRRLQSPPLPPADGGSSTYAAGDPRGRGGGGGAGGGGGGGGGEGREDSSMGKAAGRHAAATAAHRVSAFFLPTTTPTATHRSSGVRLTATPISALAAAERLPSSALQTSNTHAPASPTSYVGVECHDDNDAAELARAVDEGRRTYTRAHRTAAVVAAEAADVHAVMSAVLSAAETGSKALPSSVGVDQIDSSSGRLGSKVFRALLSNVSSVGASTAATAPLAGRLRLSNDYSIQPQRAERRTPFIRPSFDAGSSVDASSGGRRSMGGRWRWKPAAVALPVPVAEFALGGEKGGDGGGRQPHAESQPQQQEPQEPPTRSRVQRLSLRLLPSNSVSQSQQLGLPAAWASSSTGKRSRAAVDCSKAAGAEGLVDVEAPRAASTVVVSGDIMPQQHDEGASGYKGGAVAAATPQRAASSGAATAVVGAVEAPSPWGTAAVARLFGVTPSPQGGRAGIPSEMPASPAAGAAARSMGAAGVAGAGGDCVEIGGASETYSSRQGSCYLRHSSKRQVTATSFRAGLAQNAVSGVSDAVTGGGGGGTAIVWHYIGDDRNEGGSGEEDAGAAAAAALSDGVDGGGGGMLGGGEVMGAAGDGEIADARWTGSGTGGGGGLLDALRVLRTPACLLLAISNGFVTGCTLVCFNMLPSFYTEYFGCSLLAAGLAAAPFGCAAAAARLMGRWASEAAARRFGMRGRLWLMWLLQVLGGGCCMVVGLVAHRSLPACVLLLLVMAAAVQGACGVLYTITPFVSFRHAAAVTAAVSAGGYVGAVVLQAACFLAVAPAMEHGFTAMGAATTAGSAVLCLLRWPAWGGMLLPPAAAALRGDPWAEERYYAAEWSEQERAAGLATAAAVGFALASKAERPRALQPAELVMGAAGFAKGGDACGEGGSEEDGSLSSQSWAPGTRVRHAATLPAR